MIHEIRWEVTPAPESWVFDGDLKSTLLEDQIAGFEGDKVILAIHDLDVGPTKRLNDRQMLESKLGAYMERVEKAQQRAKRQDLKIFWCCLVIRNQQYLPFVQYPARRFKNWHLLSFVNASPDDPNLRPKPTRARIFRGYLRDWLGS